MLNRARRFSSKALKVEKMKAELLPVVVSAPRQNSSSQLHEKDQQTGETLMQETQIDQLQQLLSPDEHILWQGRPGKGTLLERIDYFIIPFIIFWLIIPTKVAIVALSMGHIFESLFSVPFFLIGFYLLVGRFIVKKKIMSNTFYTITDKRIIFVENKKITFVDRNNLPEVSLEIFQDGRGTINFKSNISFFNNFFGYDLFLIGSAYPRMKNIDNVQEVWKILNKQPKE